jgi:hypothetical protein
MSNIVLTLTLLLTGGENGIDWIVNCNNTGNCYFKDYLNNIR